MNAFQVFVETVFFYHPAVWWLSRQIRQERENCCDDLAVSLVGDRGTVGRMLLAIEELRERAPGLVLAATGGNLLSRVRRVVAKGRQPEPAGREWLPAAVLLLLAGLGGAAWAMSGGTTERKNPTPATPPTAAPATTAKANAPSEAKNDAKPAAKTPDVRRITGRVADSNGQPVKAACLWWVGLDDPVTEKFTVKGTSDAQGRFALEAPAAWKPRQPAQFPADILWIFAPGQELTVVRAAKASLGENKEKGIDEGEPLEIFLAPATETDYTVMDEQGRPVAGAVVEPWHYLTPRGSDFVLSGVRELLRRQTDASGRVRLSSLSRTALRRRPNPSDLFRHAAATDRRSRCGGAARENHPAGDGPHRRPPDWQRSAMVARHQTPRSNESEAAVDGSHSAFPANGRRIPCRNG